MHIIKIKFIEQIQIDHCNYNIIFIAKELFQKLKQQPVIVVVYN
ncbi:hypothetical protein [Mycoplasmopsis bovirhinis]|nr:hypothetical protein [Mycoplasmopsis bovirhinis]